MSEVTSGLPILFSITWWEIIVAGISTLAIFSFLYRENPIYRFFEHLYIGVATAIGIVGAIKYFIWPELLKPLLGFDIMRFPDGTLADPYNKANLFFLIPMAFGSLYYFILSRRHSWIAQLVIGFGLGVGGGNAFRAILNEMLPQLKDSFRPLWIPGSALESFSNILFVFTLVSAMSYFFFTFKRRPDGVVERSAAAGRWMMMGCFGAFFGATIMARMALLVERLEFLLDSWWPNIMRIFG